MSETTTTGGGFPYGFAVVMVLALFLYAGLAMNLVSLRSSDPAGNGLAAAYAAVAAVLLWIALAVALLLARPLGAVPAWATASLVVLVPLSALAACIGIMLNAEKMNWTIVVPFVVPLALAAYAAWARFPGLQGGVSPDVGAAAIVAVLVAGTVLPFVSLSS
ncbi:MAG: hypothetical protein KIT25_18145 [Enhydrobacter sp.]|nr:MAG: hypothetical protein KIT25_18145 [Enhydrobacter sp.]